MLLSIVFPAYNEERRISSVLQPYWDFFKAREVEFIIILNGCTDNTRSVVEDFVQANPGKVRFIDIPDKIGKGGAIREGFALAQGDLVGFVDADGSTSPVEYDKVVQAAIKYDGAIASRWKTGSEVINRNTYRNIASMGFRLIVKAIFWFPYDDTQCGAKVFQKKVIKEILPKLRVTNMATDVEILHFARRAGYRVVEIPSRWIDKEGSAMLGSPFNFIRSGFSMLITLLKIRFSH